MILSRKHLNWKIRINPFMRKQQVAWSVGAAFSRDHLISRLQAAPTVCFMVTWTLGISD